MDQYCFIKNKMIEIVKKKINDNNKISDFVNLIDNENLYTIILQLSYIELYIN